MLTPKELTKLKQLIVEEDPRLPAVFSALSDPTRCKVFRSFLNEPRLCVSDVSRLHGISMSLASQHLKALEQTRLLDRERLGRSVYYTPNTKDDLVRAISKAVK